MNQATKPFSNRLAVVFDFDETLIPDDSFKVLLASLNLDPDQFNQEQIQPLVDEGWEKYLARAYCLIQESKQRKNGQKITQEWLAHFGQKLQLLNGVPEMFPRLRHYVAKVDPEIEIEFYLISGGFVEIARHTSIAANFKKMWGCEFYFGANGEIEFLKKQMTHTEKTRYLFYLSKGVDHNNEKDLIYNYKHLSPENLHVPLAQTIYVGDGTSDIPCFAVINQYNGLAIGIYKADRSAQDWEHRAKIEASQRVDNLVPADYSESSELMRSLLLAIDSICKQIALRRLSIGE
ncbi:MAG: haloacid dehalogenase-like hydrolase [Symploca sp. SIO2G7]|nr:haloacid dehalogenase-like hydrolase [Symploca sp. SIO2G7]